MDCNREMAIKSSGRWLLALLLACLVLQITAGQVQPFYPNGRYGRRNTIPALVGVNREVFSAFNGETTVRCVYSGFQDYYRCSSDGSLLKVKCLIQTPKAPIAETGNDSNVESRRDDSSENRGNE